MQTYDRANKTAEDKIRESMKRPLDKQKIDVKRSPSLFHMNAMTIDSDA